MTRLIILLLCLLSAIGTNAQANLSIVVEVRNDGITIQRPNSQLMLPLPENAVAFIGTGDTIRTDSTGRVSLQLNQDTQILLLSNSSLTLHTFATSNGTFAFDATIKGNAIIQATDTPSFTSFKLQLNDLTLTEPATLMAIWSFTDVTDAVTVASGQATIRFNNQDIVIPAESGFLAEPDRQEAITFEPEWHAAGLEASLYGCKGTVQTAGNVPLLVRTGAGQGYQAMGTLDVSRVVQLMATTQTTRWTRIQYLTGFGWIRSLAIQSDCTDLTVLSDDPPEEKFVTIINVNDAELDLLSPFFETPATNAFNYRFTSN